MSNLVTKDFNKIEQVLIKGDLSALTSQEQVMYHNKVCDSLGINPLTKPFEYIKLNGKLVLYAKRDCTDQLRKLKNVSVEITKREMVSDLCIVTAKAKMPDGREDEAIGAVSTRGLKDGDLANALMKAETKAKRRVTLSICGLGFFDESEIETIQSKETREAKAREIQERVIDNLPPPEYDEDIDSALGNEPKEVGPGDYVIRIGKKYKGSKLSDVPKKDLESFIEFVQTKVENKSPDALEFLARAAEYLEQA
jgi:hypothetical protein